MTTILLSILPKWTAKIYAGEKTMELRKSVPMTELPFRVLFRESGTRLVTGEAVVASVLAFTPGAFALVDAEAVRRSRVSLSEMKEYAVNRNYIHGWELSNVRKYAEPLKVPRDEYLSPSWSYARFIHREEMTK